MVKQQTNKKYGAHLVKTFRKQQQEQTIYLICIKNHQWSVEEQNKDINKNTKGK